MEQAPLYVQTLLGVLLLTCFVKVLTVLSIVRYGLGLQLHGFGVVIVGLSLALSCLIMEPILHKFGGLAPMILGATSAAPQEVLTELRPFMERELAPGVREALQQSVAVKPGDAPPKDLSLGVLIPGFLLSEVADGFLIGFLALLPLVVIDLLVGVVVTALGIQHLSPEVIALPCKLLLFVALQGWLLVSQRLISGYGG